ncbi:MAG: ABC transporter permease [Candidatus Protochlamydia sp.]|nr:ABC transporter permease [Candidatus Protochlamydia sp.]
MSNKKNDSFIIIESNRVQKEYLKDLFRYRELFYFFAWRDILVRYKQTFLGIIWALIRPLLNMAVFAFVFGKVANLATDQVSYPLFVLAGMVPWQLFANCLVETSNSLINNAPMISKVYFPRMILPISYILVNFIDFLISLCLLFFLFIITGAPWHATLFFLPLFMISTLFLCLGTSLWMAAITVRFRDFRFIVPFVVQFGMFISPVGYGSFLVPEPWRWLYFLNPMAGIIEGFRWCCLGIYHPDLPIALTISCSISAVLFVTGFRYFRKMERIFADII